MEKIRFFHVADLHLDSPFIGLKHLPKEVFERIHDSTFASFEKVVREAIHRDIDFMIISGDLFDEEDRSIRAQAKLLKQFNLLHSNNIPVYVVHGNHDHLGSYRLELDMPDNIHIFNAKTEVKQLTVKSGTIVDIVGFSYGTRHIQERRVADYPKRSGDRYTIGILHGSEGSVHSSHETYAPFSIRELLEKNYHYWALGHIHERQILHEEPYIVYPGNIQGRHRKETGAKGCYEVVLDHHHTELTFIQTHDLMWKTCSVSLQGVQRFGEIFQRIQQALESLEEGDMLIEVILTDDESLPQDMAGKIENGDLLEALQSEYESHQGLKWIHSIRWNHTESSRGMEQDPFKQEVMETLEGMGQEEWKDALAELYEHPSIYRFLNPLKEEEKKSLIEETEHLLQNKG
ncbi:metallophosphoesterase family protein [Rossellomorea aquimaris]|uniref:metallophosphoesterase family protein n=1 Tax=Bacillaceae TaxID=186817 RepID=UPI0011ED170F|nr:DNA repair exonuclease [Bacillus sp. CH30_1T]KAA0565151.1 DNA repair exonuclease [Bacillus sp. CH30_1T]